MKRISTSTAVDGRFVDGNKSIGQSATQFSAEWCNQVQEEIANLLELFGRTLNGSERQLYDLVSDLFNQSKEIAFLQDVASGGQHSLTSAEIVSAYINGKIPVVYIGAAGQSGGTRIWFFPKEVQYTNTGDRTCEFYGFVEDRSDNRVMLFRKYYTEDHVEKYSEWRYNLTHPEKVDTDELWLSDNWRIRNNSSVGLVIEKKSGDAWTTAASVNKDTLDLTSAKSVRSDSWILDAGTSGGASLKAITGTGSSRAASEIMTSTGASGVTTMKSDFTAEKDLRVGGNFILPKLIEADFDIDLTTGDYANDTKYPVGSLICIWHSTSSSVHVNCFSIGNYELPAYGALMFVKTKGSSSSSTWRRIGFGIQGA